MDKQRTWPSVGSHSPKFPLDDHLERSWKEKRNRLPRLELLRRHIAARSPRKVTEMMFDGLSLCMRRPPTGRR